MSFIPLKPIPIKDRNSMIFIGMGRIDVKDGAWLLYLFCICVAE